MKDPFYANILFAVEIKLHEADLRALRRGLILTDSAIRSVLVRAMNAAKARPPAAVSSEAGAKDKFLAELLEQLGAVRSAIRERRSRPDGSTEEILLPVTDWVVALECLRDSCELRTGTQPGSREYLDYLRDFIGKAQMRPPSTPTSPGNQ